MPQTLELKVAPPVLAVVIAVCMAGWLWVNGLHPNSFWMRILTVAMMVGMGLAAIAFGVQNLRHARPTLNPAAPSNTSQLVTDGAYSWSRNPMYLGLLILLLALARAFDAFILYFGPLLFFLLIDRFQIRSEEEALFKKFGDEYTKYKLKVRKWL